MEKMIMTKKMADMIMDSLACMAMAASGGVIVDEFGEFDEKQIEWASDYARVTFCRLLEEWEEVNENKWIIEVVD